MNNEILRQLDFDLVYLALLTQRGIKPLSRWEATSDSTAEQSLRELGLRYRQITRSALNGKTVDELVFSKSQTLIDEYASWFDEKPLRQSRNAARTEGLLFGYPSCCVESFLTRGYVRNQLRKSDQRILFHWACPDCRVSPALVSAYREIYRECRRIRGPWPLDLRVGPYAELVQQRVMEVGSWAAALMAVGAIAVALPGVAHSGPDNPETDFSHMLSITGDTDSDGLLDVEEKFFNTSTNVFDSDGNGLPDGYDVARRLWQQIGALPTATQTNTPYIIENLAKGTVRCDVCGEIVNMGYLQVIHPAEKTEVVVPILAMHFMEHGGLRYRSDDLYFDSRVDPRLTDIVLNGHPAPRISAGQGTVSLHWHGLSGKTYRVNTTVNLNSPWTPGPTYAGADAELEHIDTNAPGTTQKFYRLSW